MLIDTWLENRLSSMSPHDGGFAQAICRAERVGSILLNDPAMGLLDYEVGGSCAKGTALAPLNDADLFIYLDPNKWRAGDGKPLEPATVLGRVRRRVEQTYRSHTKSGDVRIRPQNHSIRVRYTSPESTDVEVVPALWHEQNRGRLVFIPERETRSWVQTSVRRQMTLLERYDHPNQYLRRSIRLLKLWSRGLRLPFRSYALEILAVLEVTRGCVRHPSEVLRAALQRVVDTRLREPVLVNTYVQAAEYGPPPRHAVVIFDPAVPGNNVGDNLRAEDRAMIVAAARHTLRSLANAETALRAGDRRAARSHFAAAWKQPVQPRPVATRASAPRASMASTGSWFDRLFGSARRSA